MWRQLITWAVNNVTAFLEPPLLFLWAMLFVVGAKSLRRGVLANLPVIRPGLGPAGRAIATARIFWNFARIYTDTTRFHEQRIGLDWEVSGTSHLEQLAQEDSGIVITAHMGNYDLGAYVFARQTGRRLVLVRAPEHDPDSDTHATRQRESVLREMGKIAVQHSASVSVLDLLDALRSGGIVAIQGDRVVPGIATLETSMFGRTFNIPAGPFALAMATGAKLWPLFIIRSGRRRYRALAFPPITVTRSGRDRDADLQRAAEHWISMLELMIRTFPDQWFAFYPAFGKPAESRGRHEYSVPPAPHIPREAHWAPARFGFALSRLIARIAGGSNEALDRVGRTGDAFLATAPGKRAEETTTLATFSILLVSLSSWTLARPLGHAAALTLALVVPLLFWMVILTVTSALLRWTGLERRREGAALAGQVWVAFGVMTLLALMLLVRGNPPGQLVGSLWLILLAANAVAAVFESRRS